MYFPDSLFTRSFKHLDISNNQLMQFDSLDFDHILAYQQSINKEYNSETPQKEFVKSLSHLAFASIVENAIKFKRQEIPRTLWPYFDVVGRCINCNHFVSPEYCTVQHTIGAPSAINLIKNHYSSGITWQSMICRFRCP